MKRKPVVGDVLRIKKTDYVCVQSEKEVSTDYLRGDSYYADMFTLIKLADVGKVNPKEYLYQMPDGSMSVGKEIDLDSVEFITQVKVNTKHSVVYFIKE